MNVHPTPAFEMGERVSYQSHGQGTIVGLVTEQVAGTALQVYELRLDTGSTIKVPVAKAGENFSRLSTNQDVTAVLERLKLPSRRPKGEMWTRAEKRYFAKLSSGTPEDLADIVRDLHPRGEEIGYNVRQLYRAALSQLVSTIGRLHGHRQRSETLAYLSAASDLDFHPLDAEPTNYVASANAVQKRRWRPEKESIASQPEPARRRAPPATPPKAKVTVSKAPKMPKVPRQPKAATVPKARKAAAVPQTVPLPTPEPPKRRLTADPAKVARSLTHPAVLVTRVASNKVLVSSPVPARKPAPAVVEVVERKETEVPHNAPEPTSTEVRALQVALESERSARKDAEKNLAQVRTLLKDKNSALKASATHIRQLQTQLSQAQTAVRTAEKATVEARKQLAATTAQLERQLASDRSRR